MRRAEVADDASLFRNTGLDVFEDILHGNLIAFEADDFGDAGDLAGAVAHARLVDNNVDGGGDLFAYGTGG